MPLTYTRTFRVRHYECDAYGHVNNANYLRYMQETAFDASAAAGYGMARYAEMGRHWLIYETDVEYLRPLVYDDVIEIKTWVVDFRRVRSRRAYEIRKAGTEEIVARAQTDWVFLESENGRPAPVDRDMIAAFFPEGMPDEAPPRERFPEAPAPPPGTFRMRRKVEWRDLDQQQHVNNATYLAYMDEAGMQVSRAFGWPAERSLSEGFGIVARRHRIEYRQAAMMDDELEISTYVSNMRHSSATRHYAITRVSDGERLALAHSLYVWVDLQTGRPIHIPAQLAEDFEANIVPAQVERENSSEPREE